MLMALLAALMPTTLEAQARLESAPLVMPFSAGPVGAPYPAGWEAIPLTARKRPTHYDLVQDEGSIVLHARADAAASALGHPVAFDLRAAPIVEWRWKIDRLITRADNSVASREDSPVRVVLEFDGDRSRLPLFERGLARAARLVSGRELPYATLIYIWSNKEPVGAVIANPHTRRVEMVVASSGPAGVATWQALSRNALEDFRRAFGEEPGKLTAVGVLTDTDNTGDSVDAWYGDIRFVSAR